MKHCEKTPQFEEFAPFPPLPLIQGQYEDYLLR